VGLHSPFRGLVAIKPAVLVCSPKKSLPHAHFYIFKTNQTGWLPITPQQSSKTPPPANITTQLLSNLTIKQPIELIRQHGCETQTQLHTKPPHRATTIQQEADKQPTSRAL